MIWLKYSWRRKTNPTKETSTKCQQSECVPWPNHAEYFLTIWVTRGWCRPVRVSVAFDDVLSAQYITVIAGYLNNSSIRCYCSVYCSMVWCWVTTIWSANKWLKIKRDWLILSYFYGSESTKYIYNVIAYSLKRHCAWINYCLQYLNLKSKIKIMMLSIFCVEGNGTFENMYIKVYTVHGLNK